jgi:hypothetical protein
MNPRFLLYASGAAFLVTGAGVAATYYLYSLQANGGEKQVARSAPGPVAALGLPASVVIGGYVWLRRRSRNRGEKE